MSTAYLTPLRVHCPAWSGSKDGLLALSIGFNRVEGIAVDTHVHKVSNRSDLAHGIHT